MCYQNTVEIVVGKVHYVGDKSVPEVVQAIENMFSLNMKVQFFPT